MPSDGDYGDGAAGRGRGEQHDREPREQVAVATAGEERRSRGTQVHTYTGADGGHARPVRFH